MDVQMPVMDGMEATRRIRQLPGCENLPIIALTANAFEEDREECRKAGMSEFMSKPFESETLFSVILKILQPEPALPGDPSLRLAGTDSTSPGDSPLLTNLRQIPGLDTITGLRFAQNKPDFYLRLLRKFARSVRHIELLERHAQGDLKGAHLSAHSLKSMAATIGATSLSRAAAEAEGWLALPEQVPPTLADHLQEIAAEFERLANAVIQVLGSADTDPAGSVPSAQGSSGLDPAKQWEALLVMLENGDVGARRLIQQDQEALHRAFGAEAHRLKQQVDAYAFEEALTTLRKLLTDRQPARCADACD